MLNSMLVIQPKNRIVINIKKHKKRFFFFYKYCFNLINFVINILTLYKNKGMFYFEVLHIFISNLIIILIY